MAKSSIVMVFLDEIYQIEITKHGVMVKERCPMKEDFKKKSRKKMKI